jgi:excisionase family DNA binding protein
MEKAIFLSMSIDDLEDLFRKVIREEIVKTNQPIDPNKDVLDFDEALNYTGFSDSYMYKLTSGRKIPHYKPTGRKIFFKREELDKWLLENRVKTDDELDAEAATYVATH